MNITKSAFSLVELLVVITIMAVLLALLAPALDRAMDQAQRAVCASRLDTIVMGTTIYITENRQVYYICRGRQVTYAFDTANPKSPHPTAVGAESGDRSVDWLAALATVDLASRAKVPTTPPSSAPRHRPGGMWKCPSAIDDLIWMEEQGAYIVGYTYYGGVKAWRHGTQDVFYAPAPSPSRRSKSSGNWVLVSDRTFFNEGSWTTSLTNHPIESGPAGSNQAFVDGSVAWSDPARLYVGHTWNPNLRIQFIDQSERPPGFEVTDSDRAASF